MPPEGSHFQVRDEACFVSDVRNVNPTVDLSHLTSLTITNYFSHIIHQIITYLCPGLYINIFLTCPFGQLTKKRTCPTQSFSCPNK
jgi:hypothetical protein